MEGAAGQGLSGHPAACPRPPRQQFPRHWGGPGQAGTEQWLGTAPSWTRHVGGQASQEEQTLDMARSAPLVRLGGFLPVDLSSERPAEAGEALVSWSGV